MESDLEEERSKILYDQGMTIGEEDLNGFSVDEKYSPVIRTMPGKKEIRCEQPQEQRPKTKPRVSLEAAQEIHDQISRLSLPL